MSTPSGDLIERACTAWAPKARRAGLPAGDIGATRVEQIGTLEYVAVRDAHGSLLTVYRVRRYDGVLRAMKRWPRSIR